MARRPAKPKTPPGILNFAALAEALRRVHEQSAAAASRADARELRRYRRFYLVYPHIRESLTPVLGADGKTLITRLSFTHLADLIELDDPLKRAFYEVECIRGHWSVRALKRQIATLYFERSGLSTDKQKLAALAHAAAEQAEPELAIRDPYLFEFLGLRPKEAVSWVISSRRLASSASPRKRRRNSPRVPPPGRRRAMGERVLEGNRA